MIPLSAPPSSRPLPAARRFALTGSPWATPALAVLLPVALALAVGCGPSSPGSSAEAAPSRGQGRPGFGGNGPPAERIAVEVVPVTQEPMSSFYSTSATLRADQRATVTARTRGVVERLVVEEGHRVAAGEPLAHLEDDEQAIEAERTRAAFETAERELERSQRLFEQGLVSEEAFEATRRTFRDAEQAAALAELELSRTVIRAPFAGTVVRRHLDVGNTVADGTPVFDVADLSPLYADVNVPERHVARLAPGQRVRLTADASGQTAEAVIERIAPAVDAETGTVKVTLALEGSGTLRPGSFVRVDIITDTHPEALVVPRSALVAEGRHWYLYRVGEGGATAEQVEVELGYDAENRVEVLPTGAQAALAAGDRVVAAGAGALSDGAAIEIADGADDVGT